MVYIQLCFLSNFLKQKYVLKLDTVHELNKRLQLHYLITFLLLIGKNLCMNLLSLDLKAVLCKYWPSQSMFVYQFCNCSISGKSGLNQVLGFLSKREEKLIDHSCMAQLQCVLPLEEQSLHLRQEMVSIMEIGFIRIELLHLHGLQSPRVAAQLVLIFLLGYIKV